MDIQYILLNTVIYGIVALVIANFFSFGKMLNMSIGGFMVMGGYVIYNLIAHGISVQTIIILIGFIGLFILINRAIFKYFPHDKQKYHVGVIATLGISIIIENLTNYIYGPNSINLNIVNFNRQIMLIIFITMFGLFYYVFKHTLLGATLRGIEENTKTVKSLGIKTNKILQILFLIMLILLIVVAFIILNEANIRASDGIFYLIKGIGIMILVGISKKEYMLFGALLYVLMEYLLFIQIGLPISYKETLILIVILGVLLFKPEGLFTFSKRKI
ncbi:hypothetical protein K9M48_01110 [Candidatus Gracilibacteria bacterium]|nr:hypothetical protein [Candidatus Gracilibacteria bacterium]